MTLSFSPRRWAKQCVALLNRSLAALPRKRRRMSAPPTLEYLEGRITPSAVSWTGNAGTLNWGDANNWSNLVVPVSVDDVTISKAGIGTISLGGASYAVRTLNDSTASLSITSGASLSLAAVNANSLFGQNVTISFGGTLTVGAGASLQIASPTSVTLADNGVLSFGANDMVTLNSIIGPFGGTATAQIVVSAGGELKASSTTFAAAGGGTSQVVIDSDAVLNAGDLVGNAFNLPLFIPAVDVQYLSGAGNNNLSFHDIDIQPGTLTSGQNVALNAIGIQTTANLRYVFLSNFTVGVGASLTVGPNVNVQIASPTALSSVTLADNGVLSFGANDTVTLNSGFDTTAQIVVSGGGDLKASGTTFAAAAADNGVSQVVIDSDAVLNAGDLVGNAFNLPLFIPAIDVQYLYGAANNNLSFHDIDIQQATLTNGQNVVLNAIGTATTANLRYVFLSNFTVGTGASLTVGPNVNVQIASPTSPSSVTLADQGVLSFGANDAVTLNSHSSSVLSGTTAQIVASGGGELKASSTTFAAGGNGVSQVVIASDAVQNAGDLVGNAFNLPLFIPAVDVQYLSGAGNNNLSFHDIDIQPGTLTSGQSVALNAIGTATTANLRYLFSSNFTVGTGASLTVGPNVNVQIADPTSPSSVTLADNGVLSFGANDTVTLNSTTSFGGGTPSTQIVVSGGGELKANSTTFAAAAAGTGVSQVVIASDAVLNAGDLVGNAFNLPLFIPAVDVQYLYGAANNNLSFHDIDVQPATLTSGQSVALNAIGTATTANLRYVFLSNFTVGTGASLTVGPNVNVQIASPTSPSSVTLADQGVLSFGANDAVTLNSNSGFFGTTTAQIVVSGGGDLKASGTTFAAAGTGVSQVVVNSGGQLQASTSTFVLSQLNLNTGSNDTLSADFVSGPFTINSGATINIADNDFTDIGTNGLIAVGDPSATIHLENNYWGTTNSSQIDAKIEDHNDDSSRPTVSFSPFLTEHPAQTAAAPVTVSFTTGAPNVALSATVTSTAGTVNEGTETFTILNGTTVIGTAVTVNVVNGAASATYALPAGTAGGSYTIQAVYNGTANFLGYTDASQVLTINAAASATAAATASATFNSSTDTVALSATVTSAAGTINEGTETFTILNGTTVIGTAVTVNVVSGAAAANYTLPAGIAGGSYTIQAVYNGTADFLAFTDASQVLTISAAASATAAAAASTGFTFGAQTVALSATVTSAAGTVSQGTETFTILNGVTVIGTAVTVNVVSGAASASYTLPAGTTGGSYTIQAVYNGAADFLAFTDSTHHLIVSAAASATAAATASATFNSSTDTVSLSATVTSIAGTINEGTETFTILNGTTVIGTAVTVNVVSGAAAANYTLPAGIAGGSYTIQAVYNGTADFLAFTDASQVLTIYAAASATAAATASATFNSSTDTVALGATVTSAAGTVSQGTETFTILNGTTVIGTAVTVNVVGGAAAANYTLPAGVAGGSYIIQAVYNGTADFLAFTDASHVLTINAAASATAAATATATFNATADTVALSATVTSGAGTINEGTETFTILNGTTVIGTAVTVNVVNGAAAANYTLPAGIAGGSYTIQAVYNGTADFLAFTDSTHHLTVSAAASATAAAAASATFNSSTDTVALSATVTSGAGTVNEGAETFTILNGTTVIGAAVTVNVVNGAASANYTLPAGIAGGSYTIQAVYNGTADFLAFTDVSQILTIHAAASATAAAAVTTGFSSSAQTVALSATVTSAAGTVNQGTETFTILNGTTVIGTAVTVNVVSGAAAASYTLPAGTAAGPYTIQAVYNGTADFLAFTDASQVLTVSTASAATTTAATATATFNSSSQTVALSATVTSGAGTVNEGTETFTILNGVTVIGTAVTVNVVSGAASASYTLPAGTTGGSYTIQAVYNGTANFLTFTDSTHHLTVSAAASATAAAAASATFNTAAETVALSATVTSAAGTVNEGTETFTILNGTTVIGTAVTVNVVSGVASGNYTLPAGIASGSYTIQAVYNSTVNFLAFTDNTHHLTVSAAASATAAATASTTFNSSAQTVALSATVTSAAGTVNEGTETFTILNGTTVIGTAVMVNVVNGAAGGNYTLPASIAGGSYTIQAVYNGTADFLAFTDNTHHLTVNAAASTTTAANATAVYNSAAQTVALSATATSAAGTVNEGTETFTILSGATVVGSPITVSVINGAAHASYTLPAGVSLGSYTIRAVYNGDANYLASTDASHTLTVSAAVRTTAVLKSDGSLWQYTAASGLQLLSPAGTILSVSAIADSAGNADFYAVTADHHLWEHTVAGWAFLSAGSFQQISAATNAAGNAVIFAVLTDNSLWENSSLFPGNHWQNLSPGGTILSISAVTDAAGHDDVYAVTSDNHLWEHTPTAWSFLSADSFQQISAGLNGAGQALVFGVLTDHSLWENNPTFAGDHWRLLSPAGTILSVSAGGADDVFAITSDHRLWEHKAAGWGLLSVGSFASLSGATNTAGQGDVFAVLTDTSFWEYDPAFPGWRILVQSGVASGSAARTR
jgi:Bacterial Ig-like domain (group 3)